MRRSTSFHKLSTSNKASSIQGTSAPIKTGQLTLPCDTNSVADVQLAPEVQLAADVQLAPEVQLAADVQLAPEVQLAADVQLAPEVQLAADVQLAPEVQLAADVQLSADVQLTQNDQFAPGVVGEPHTPSSNTVSACFPKDVLQRSSSSGALSEAEAKAWEDSNMSSQALLITPPGMMTATPDRSSLVSGTIDPGTVPGRSTYSPRVSASTAWTSQADLPLDHGIFDDVDSAAVHDILPLSSTMDMVIADEYSLTGLEEQQPLASGTWNNANATTSMPIADIGNRIGVKQMLVLSSFLLTI
jgi:hypothetical protein